MGWRFNAPAHLFLAPLRQANRASYCAHPGGRPPCQERCFEVSV